MTNVHQSVNNMLTFIKAFVLINVVFVGDKLLLLVADLLSINIAENFLREFQLYINIGTSVCILALTIIKIIKAIKSKSEEK